MSDIDYQSCTQVFARLDDWVDRELSPGDLEQIQKHLEICARCAYEFQIEDRVLRSIREKLSRIRLPDGLEARVWRRIARAAEDGPGR